jgi:HK97 family phage portal protein
MNLLQRAAFWALRAYPAPQPVTWETVFGSSQVYTGISVTEHSALDYAPVWAGVGTLSRDVAKLPLVLNKNLPNGGTERFKSHPLYRILHDEWNPEMSSYKARETMQALCLLYGNAYAEIVRDGIGRPVGMYPIDPTRVTPLRDEDTGRLAYRVTNGKGRQTIVIPANMIHISSLSLDGIIGQSIVAHARESFGLGIAVERFGGTFFGNGATFGGVVEVPGLLTEAAKDNVRTAIEAVHAGVERAHKILVLAGGSKFNARGTAPNEAQMVEVRKFQVTEVARWLNMPAHKLGDLENAHFTNIEEQELQYYQGCVSGWLEMWEQELTRKLIAPLEYKQQSIEHVMEGVLRGSSAQRADFYTKLFNIGAININRILQLENMNPIGPAGDVHLVPLNMIPLERYGEWIDAQIEAKKAPPVKQLPPKDDEPASESKADERMLKIQEMMTSLTAGFDQERREWEALIHKVTVKLDDEMVTHAGAAEAARQAQADAEALAARAEAASVQAAQEAQEARDRAAEASAALQEATEKLTLALRAQEQASAEASARQAQIEAAQADVAATEAVLAEAKAQAEQDSQEAQTRAAEAQAELQGAAEQLAAAVSAHELAKADAAAKDAQIEAVRAEVAITAAALQQAEALALERLTLAEAFAKKAEDAIQAVQEHVLTAEQVRAELVTTQAEREAQQAKIAELEEARQKDQDIADELAAKAVLAEQAAQTRLVEAENARAELITTQSEREVQQAKIAELEAARQVERDRLIRVVTAHRALIADVVQRLIRPEVDRARRRQNTPESLRKWADAFYQTHREVCADALYPVVMTHLAWKRSDEDPREAAVALAEAHCSDSERQLQAVIEGSDPEEFHARLELLLQRWEAERPNKLADQVLTDELHTLASHR